METDLIISAINDIHQQTDAAFEKKDVEAFSKSLDDTLKYTNADGSVFNKKELTDETEKYFRNTKDISTTYYRIKSTFEDGVFIEKIARKSVVHIKKLLFSKKQTIQTEEIFNWKKINGEWKATAIEITLEEKY